MFLIELSTIDCLPRGAYISFTQRGSVKNQMDKTCTDNEVRNIKDATVIDPEVNVCYVKVQVSIDAPMTY